MNPYATYFACAVLLLLVGLTAFEILLHRLFMNDHKAWLEEGAPQPLLESQDMIGFGQWLAKWRLHRKLLFSTPHWLEYDRTGRAFLIVFRISTIVGFAAIVGFPIIALLLS